MRWFHVVETREAIEGGKELQWQVTLKIDFTLEHAPEK
jgi:flavin-binding protein dodecin